MRRARITGVVLTSGLAVLPGAAVFGWLFLPILDPRDMGWLFSPNPLTFDVAASGMGWLFYSTDTWHWPLGANPRYAGNIANSLLYSDSLPAFAAPMKVVFQILGGSGASQVIGLGILVCLVAQSALGYALVRVSGGTRMAAFLGSWFFVLSPVLLMKWNIASLFWQWLVLAAMLVALLPLSRWLRTLAWCLLIIVATGINPYIALMLAVMGSFDHMLRSTSRSSWVWTVLGILSMAGSTILGLYAWGAFSLRLASADSHSELGAYSASDLSLIDSNGLSWFLRDLPGGTGEGLGYTGLGVLVLLIVSAVGWLQGLDSGSIKRPYSPVRRFRSWPVGVRVLLVSSLTLAILAVLPELQIGPWSVRVPLPTGVEGAFGTFRANGRFIWPAVYSVTLAAVVLGARSSVRRIPVLVCVALAVQVVDLHEVLRTVRGQVEEATTMLPRFQAELVPELKRPGVRAIEVVPAYPYPPEVPWREIGLAAHEASLPLSSIGYLNRYDTPRLIQVRDRGTEDFRLGRLRRDTVYVVSGDLYKSYLSRKPHVRVVAHLDSWVALRLE